ncbi:MAG TPA: glycine hydroxymethyltransferase [Candidatus Hydrogenedentes bacterium]|nr:glycine hydroxymethyltransferase [Candidatus Hydrogenedentota bacterium]HRT21009.1 glycine hydroxymethyltransferase [Candidatus Hydrogenedentota bacterium]HRT65838.1 glycine hydroxymethyltransferase [Candidatus Hydrogenedentota bacterium]
MNPCQAYLKKTPPEALDEGFLAYIANLSETAKQAPAVAKAIVQELADQRRYLKLIASENYCSLSTQLAMGNLLTDKYAEGVPGTRFYEGCDNVDAVEAYACDQARKLFQCDHAYVQPHSGADANLIAYWAVLQARVETPELTKLGLTDPAKATREQWEAVRDALGHQRLLGMDYYSGGHLTHGYRRNVSAKMFDAYSYGVNRETNLIDYDEIERMAREIKPLILLAGFSAYPRKINFRRMRAIADAVGAVFMVDMAHFAGLVAGGVFEGDFNPMPHAHIVTSTTHKTLRGPRGGIVLCTAEFAEYVDKGCPLVIGGPLGHIMAAKAVALTEANTPSFKAYAKRIVENARALAEACIAEGLVLSTGGTDNHLMLIDMRPLGLTGKQGAAVLRACGITLNSNSLPYDPHGPLITSGLRIGTPAVTTLGMGTSEMREIARIIRFALSQTKPGVVESGPNAGKPSKIKYEIDDAALAEARAATETLLKRFPVYPQLDLAFLQEHFA